MSAIPDEDPFSTPTTTIYGSSRSENRLDGLVPRLDPPDNAYFGVPDITPAQLKRRLEAQLKNVQKRQHEAAESGRRLLEQQSEIENAIKELALEAAANGEELNAELKEKLADLEREYNEVHRESTRVLMSSKISDSPYRQHTNPSTFQSLGSNSPTKLSVPSRRQRNQATRNKDVSWASDIANSLLMEVRKLQGALIEKEETLKLLKEEKDHLERQAALLESRIKSLDESEQRYKEENWNLELSVQELQAQQAERKDVEIRLQNQIAQLTQEREYLDSKMEDLKQAHAKTNDDNEAIIQHHEAELSNLRRTLATVEADREAMSRRLEDLKQELEESHKASLRLKHAHDELANANRRDDPFQLRPPDEHSPESSPPPSPTKQTPRHGALQSETLKSSLQHAHRLIANLKSSNNREKAEKAELKKLLNEAREEIEQYRNGSFSTVSSARKKREPPSDIKFRKPIKLNLLGAGRRPKSEIELIDSEADLGWEDEAELSPLGTRELKQPVRTFTEESTGFETAQETALETDAAFETAHEDDVAKEGSGKDYPTSADDLTETELPPSGKVSSRGSKGSKGSKSRKQYSGLGAFEPSKKKSFNSLTMSKVRGRDSIVDIGSEDDDDVFRLQGYRGLGQESADELHPSAPATLGQQRLKLRIRSGRGKMGNRIPSDGSIFGINRQYSREGSPATTVPPTTTGSPVGSRSRLSSVSGMSEVSDGPVGGQSLFAELGSFGGEDYEEVETEEDEMGDENGTPTRASFAAPAPAIMTLKPMMRDTGCNTEVPYPEPQIIEKIIEKIIEMPVTPPPRAVMVHSETQVTPTQRPIFVESSTQASPASKPLLVNSETQSSPAPPTPVYVHSFMQSIEELKALTSSIAVQSEPVSVSSSGVQSDEISKAPTSSTGMQSDAELLPAFIPVPMESSQKRSSYVSAGSQSNDEVISERSILGTQLDSSMKAPTVTSTAAQSDVLVFSSTGIQVEAEPKPLMVAASTQSEPKIIKMMSSGTQFDPELENVEQKVLVLPLLTPPVPKLVEAGTQSNAEMDTKEPEVVVAPVVKPEVADYGTQFDAEIEAAAVVVPVVVANATQTEIEMKPIPRHVISIVAVADQEPIAPETIPMSFSSIESQDVVPIEAEKPLPLGPIRAPQIPVVEQTTSSDEDTPKKVSESLDDPSQRPRPTTPSPQPGKPSFLGGIFSMGMGRAPEAANAVENSAATTPTIRHLSDNKGKGVMQPMLDQAVQTAIGADFFDKPADKTPVKPILIGSSAMANGNPPMISLAKSPGFVGRASQDSMNSRAKGVMITDNSNTVRRPGSSSSRSEQQWNHPPLPQNHQEQIAAAQNKQPATLEPTTVMGPPAFPASATRQPVVSFRPKTPVNQYPPRTDSAMSRTTRPRVSASNDITSPGSHRSSMSSFASELDDRFRMDDAGYQPSRNDPRIIQAITQTMIGEFLWKYTRSPTRGTISQNRHKRYFWIHPYTRTLYWSAQDPSIAGKQEINAKSVSIEAVHVVNDDNPMPPGLHRKSIIIVTPGRTIKFTCPTGQRHETWYTALSHLLARSLPEEEEEDSQEDVNDFDPYTTRSASALSSYRSRGARAVSPIRNASSLSNRRPAPVAYSSVSSRISSMFRPGTYSRNSSRQTSNEIYHASDVNDSIDEFERHDDNSDKLENVRACCDGKHDVGTLTRTSGKNKKGQHQHTHSGGWDHTHHHNHDHHS